MILQGDCLEVLKSVKDNTIDSLVTDPPYGINFMGKSWDNFEPGQKKLDKVHTEKNTMANTAVDAMTSNHPQYKFEGMIEFYVPIVVRPALAL